MSIYIDDSSDSGGIDLLEFSVCHDDEYLYVKVKLDTEIDLTEDFFNPAELMINIDADNNSSTGYSTNNIGSEYGINFYNKFIFDDTDYPNVDTLSLYDLDVIPLPTYSSDEFEIAINRSSFSDIIAISIKKTNENEAIELFLLKTLPKSNNPPPANFPIALDKAWASPHTPTNVPAASGRVRSSISDKALFVAIPADIPKINSTLKSKLVFSIAPLIINSPKEIAIIQQPSFAEENLPILGMINRPPINSPINVPIPQYALSKVVLEIGNPNTSAPKLSKIGSWRNRPNV